jgi:hypothetical protein
MLANNPAYLIARWDNLTALLSPAGRDPRTVIDLLSIAINSL